MKKTLTIALLALAAHAHAADPTFSAITITGTAALPATTTVSGTAFGGAAWLNTGTAAGTVAAGDDTRIINAVQVGGTTTNLSVTGNTTLGDAAGDTLTINATTTATAPMTLTGQPSNVAATASTAATMSLVDDEPFWTGWIVYAHLGINMASSVSGSGAGLFTARPGWVGLQFSSTATTGAETGTVTLYRDIGTNSGSGAGTNWSAGEYLFRVSLQRGSAVYCPGLDYRLIFGGTTGTTGPLASKGVGLVFGYTATSNTIQLVAHNGASLTLGQTINTTTTDVRETYLVRVVSGTVALYSKSSPTGRVTTLLDTISGGPTGLGPPSADGVILNFSTTNGIAPINTNLRINELTIGIK